MPDPRFLLHRRVSPGLRLAMYRGLCGRGWSRARAAGYAVRNPKSFAALAEAVETVGVCPAGHGFCPCRRGSTSHAHCLAERRAA